MVAIICLLGTSILLLCLKLHALKQSAREIRTSFESALQNDTNVVIGISSRDRDMAALADSINRVLQLLRQEHLQYRRGDLELKNAITNISHDLRTPLTAICGYTDLLLKTEDLTEAQSYAGIIRERADVMRELTEELFSYTLLTAEGDADHAESAEETNVNQVLQECIAGAYPALTARGIEPVISLPEELVIRTLNRGDLSRVFSNLLNNAVKYSDGDLEITMTADGEITFSNTSQKLSTISVGQLFDRFFTVESGRSSTGLGLSIARTLVRRMGGSIDADYKDRRLIIRIRL